MQTELDKSAILNRIKEYYELKTDVELAAFLGIGKSTLSNWYKRNSIDYDLLFSKCEHINLDWLLTGKGEMTSSNYEMIDDGIDVPIMNVEAAAGFGSINQSYIESQGVIRVPKHFIKNNMRWWWVNVSGESMAPTLQNHSLILANEIHPSEWREIKDNHIYVLTNRDGETFIKRIKNRLTERGELILMSDNLDRQRYPAMYWNAEEVIGVWHAEFYLTTRMENINETYYSRLRQLEDRVDGVESILGDFTLKEYKNKSIK